ncbi:hypothetical protein [Catellatospora paridis]|uniref:hypothetical protein n=1 Tax=Catellatospora paridis TaxID=1617086 RepID=UPI0012D42FC1|nr:hypothetical protein [Catellatospora paridis]
MGARVIRFGDVAKARVHLDDPDVLAKAATWPALMMALEMGRPRNCWGSAVKGPRLLAFARKYGVPLAWVPSVEIVKELVASPDRDNVDAILIRDGADIVDDCARVIGECDEPALAESRHLASAVIAAYRAGHVEPATALAVNMTESMAVWASTPRVRAYDSFGARDAWQNKLARTSKYSRARLELDEGGQFQVNSFLTDIIMAPIPSFFTPWRETEGAPPPEQLSRHAVVHQPVVKHLTPRNAVVAIMLMTSLLRQQQDWCEEVGPDV